MARQRILRVGFSLAALLAATLAVTAPASGQASPLTPYRDGDRSITAMNILPPGQGRYMNAAELAQAQATGQQPPHNTDQLDMYDSMVQGAAGITAANLATYYKDASFGVKADDIERQYSPRPGVVVLRDKGFGVPHIYGTTRADTLFGAGYVTAEDRLFMIDVLRHAGRGRLTEFLGASKANLALDCATYLSGDYTEAELQAMLERTGPDPEAAALADQARQDVQDYVAGINKYIQEALANPSKLPGEYAALQQVPKPWKATDTVAVAVLIGANFGVGGGDELENAAFLDALEGAGLTPQAARATFNDFRFANDPEAPTTAEPSFPWNSNLGPVDPASVGRPDAGTVARRAPSALCDTGGGTPTSVDGPLGPIPLLVPEAASNALLIGPQLSASGRPLAVFGPQTGYWSPEILMELDMHGPGLHARGVGFPGISMYVLLGRGDGYGWSATSASGDLVDTRAVALCEPGGAPATTDSDNYVRARDGACVPIHTRTDSWLAKPTAGSCPPGTPPNDPGCVPTLVQMTTERVELAESTGTPGDLSAGAWGIVIGRGEVGGEPVAYVRQRSTYGAEVDSAAAYVEVMDPARINGAADFHRAFGRFNFTFNWFYLDEKDVANQLVGAHPIRAQGTDIDLPVRDGLQWKWQGFLPFEGRPHVTSPSKGFITSWNNKQAPGFRASDKNWGFGPVHRSQPLDDRILAAAAGDGKVDLVEVVRAMADAATVDLRGDKVLPFMLQVIGDPGTQRLQAAVDLLTAWRQSGAHRRDLDGNGIYEHAAAVALMDEWWERALTAVFKPVLGAAYDAVPYEPCRTSQVNEQREICHDDHPALSPVGSAFYGGWYSHLQKDLRSVLGAPVQGPFSRQYCGSGQGLAACRAALLDSLDQAVAALEQRDGQNPDAWDAREEDDFIRFAPLGVQGQQPMQWQNRPTFQQVLEFGVLSAAAQPAAQPASVLGAKQKACPRAGQRHQVVGTPGRDVLRGTKGSDVLCGFGGADRLMGRGGEDLILGSRGRDRLSGGAGDDELRGGPGRDRCWGGRGTDVLGACRP